MKAMAQNGNVSALQRFDDQPAILNGVVDSLTNKSWEDEKYIAKKNLWILKNIFIHV